MSEDTSSTQLDYVEISAGLVSAYVSNNSVRAADLPELIRTVHRTLAALKSGAGQGGENQTEKPTPAQIKKSITPEALISFEDGKPYKTLKRHLANRGLTPGAYREKYGLAADYPMTASGYSARRSELARALGLGQLRKKP
ncbi:Ros/MucR family transcriptional regulator [Methylorubrum extorquens]